MSIVTGYAYSYQNIVSNLPYYKTLTTTNHNNAPLSMGIHVRRRSFFYISKSKTFLCPEISLIRLESPSFIFVLSFDTSHKGYRWAEYGIIIRSKVHTVRTFPLYFCISPAKVTSKYQNFLGQVRRYLVNTHANDIGSLAFPSQAFWPGSHGCYFAKRIAAICFYSLLRKILWADDVTANYKQLQPIDFYKISSSS